jgi:choline-sulfatase
MTEMKPMNQLIIFSDQHSKRMMGCYGNPCVKTPNLDRLAAGGVRFDNAYCNSPICVPSRAALATGDYASRHNYWDNAHGFAGECPSWGRRLNEQGFAVTTIGKLHFKGEMPETGFTDQRIPLNMKNGIGDVYGSIRNKTITRYQFRQAIEQAGAGESDYLRYDRAIARQAAEYLKTEGTRQQKPFALFVGFVTPHFPLIAPQEFLDLYRDDAAIRRPIAFDRSEWPHHPVIDSYRYYCGTENLDCATTINAIKTYYALCSFMDAQAGIVLDALREAGLEENTRIIYSSDHGDTMGDHGVYFKSTMYDGSVGIPLLVSAPDLPKGKTRNTNVSLVDIFPTVVECVGAETNPADQELPGKSLWGYAKGEEDPTRAVFSEYYAQGIYTAMFMLKKGDYKYVHYVGESPQLFNLKTDPEERRDLALEPDYAALCKQLESELRSTAKVDDLELHSKAAQRKLLEDHGGEAEFLRNFKPTLFSPIPPI